MIVLVNERPEPLEGLYDEYAPALEALGGGFEFIFAIASGQTHVARDVEKLRQAGKRVESVTVGHAVSEAALANLAIAKTRGSLILMMPAYRRIEASALAPLIERVEAGADLATARRWPRKDSWINRLQNRVFHSLLRVMAGEGVRDVACGVRVMRPGLLGDIGLYGDFLRYLPFLAMREGYQVVEVPSPQHPADVRARVYAPGIYLRRLIDALGLAFLIRFTEKPLRFFGVVGAGFAIVGIIMLGVVLFERFGGQPAADRPLMLLGVLLVVLGVQAIALGLIGEIIVHLHATRRQSYRVARPDRRPPSP